ncbi:MAG: 3-dehydroquinate synthase [Planctomycetota bacterium]|nr:3-dehydroquinate synthase [Planctomycetota bacterium]
MSSLRVNCPGGSYDVLVEPGGLQSLGRHVDSVLGPARCLLIADSNVASTHAVLARDALEAAGIQASLHLVEACESNKRLSTVEDSMSSALAAGLDRNDCIVSIGGGLVGDVAGFAAASFLRGIALVQVPTTLLAMVDASIGGKTGVNLILPGSEDLGKNLAGAFWQPRLVLADPEVLATLDERERRCGLAECVKHGLIGDPQLLSVLSDDLEPLLAVDPEATARLIEHAAQVKIGIVEEDERESGRRALLNLGHTFAHAIETDEALDLKHGEAVSIGLMAATSLAELRGMIEGEWVDDLRSLLGRIGLPLELPLARDPAELIARMRFDKKVRSGQHRLILPVSPGRVECIDDVEEDSIHHAWMQVMPS